MQKHNFDCVILGGGPAGLSSALYCKRANLNCAIIDISLLGGMPTNYLEIENYLGYPKINGYELSEKFEQHVDNFETPKFPFEEITKVDLISSKKQITTKENVFEANAVIIATGAKPKKLNIKGEEENIGHGVSFCAVCDGAFYKDKTVAVIGGGNSALEESMYLTQFAKKVYLIHRRDEFRAEDIVQKRVLENKKIEIVFNSIPVEINGNNKVESLKIKNTVTSKEKTIKVDGVFPYIGLEPNVEYFSGQLNEDKQGFILTDNCMKTNIDGVYAVGDVRNTPLRQVITAVSDGAIAGVQVSKYLMNLKEKVRS